jgi:hypothetical protein
LCEGDFGYTQGGNDWFFNLVVCMARRQQRFGTVLLATLVAMVACVLTAAPASAHAGAIGSFTGKGSQYEEVPLQYNPKTHMFRVVASGYAYNHHTKPAQAIKLEFWSSTSDDKCGSYPNGLRHTTSQYVANHKDAKDAKKIHSSTANVGWSYSSGWRTASWGDIQDWRVVQLYVHDKGESGGWVMARQWCT